MPPKAKKADHTLEAENAHEQPLAVVKSIPWKSLQMWMPL